jgi:diguanylate cyclase (GGDEF)-like protein
VELQEQLIAAREQLRIEGMHDSLTGLLNRGAVFDVLRTALAFAERQGTPLAVIIGDLDHFKDINDRYGHLVGDGVLNEAACRMRGALRASDSIGRYGGEEFLVVAPGCTLEAAELLAERARKAICEVPILVAGHSIRVSMSLGVSGNEDRSQSSVVFSRADQALYQAKRSGRNKVAVGHVSTSTASVIAAGGAA